MSYYLDLIDKLVELEPIKRIARNEIDLQYAQEPSGVFAFLPCFIPLVDCSLYLTMTGILKHWFVLRDSSFATLSFEGGFLLYEESKTEQQFLIRLLMENIQVYEECNPEIVTLSRDLGIDNYNEIVKLWQEKGDDCYFDLDDFKVKIPCIYPFEDCGYKGDAAFSGMDSSYENLRNYASTEIIESGWENKILENTKIPLWFKEQSQVNLFDKFFEEKDFHSAWLTANSRGWKWKDLRQCIFRLAESVSDELFHLQCNMWLSHNHEKFSEGF